MSEWSDAYNDSSGRGNCDCDWPFVLYKGSPVMGLVVEIDMCCVVKELEALTSKTFTKKTYTTPADTWDGSQVVEISEGVTGPKGDPPDYMHTRMHTRSIGHKHTADQSLTPTH